MVVKLEILGVSELIRQDIQVNCCNQHDKDDHSADVRPDIDKLVVTLAQTAHDTPATEMIDSISAQDKSIINGELMCFLDRTDVGLATMLPLFYQFFRQIWGI